MKKKGVLFRIYKILHNVTPPYASKTSWYIPKSKSWRRLEIKEKFM